jgi:hypothetical protein
MRPSRSAQERFDGSASSGFIRGKSIILFSTDFFL